MIDPGGHEHDNEPTSTVAKPFKHGAHDSIPSMGFAKLSLHLTHDTPSNSYPALQNLEHFPVLMSRANPEAHKSHAVASVLFVVYPVGQFTHDSVPIKDLYAPIAQPAQTLLSGDDCPAGQILRQTPPFIPYPLVQ
jgi:hypothetical protein